MVTSKHWKRNLWQFYIHKQHNLICANCRRKFETEKDHIIVYGETQYFGRKDVDRINWMGLMHNECFPTFAELEN